MQIPIYASAEDLRHLLDLKKAGATDAILEDAETCLQLGSKLLKGFGVMSDDVNFLSQLFRDSMELQAQESLGKSDDRETEIMKPLQVRVSDFNGVRENNSPRANQKDATDILSFRGKVDDDPQQTVNSEDDGVLYCNLEKGNGLSIESNKTGEKILTEDTLIPLTQKMEEL